MHTNSIYKKRLHAIAVIAATSWLFWIVALALVFAWINWDIVTGHAVAKWDADAQYMPWQMLVYDSAHAFKFALWDPWTNGGIPVSGDPQVAAFSPISCLIGLIFGGSTGVFRFYWLTIWWLGGLGVMLVARHFGVRPFLAFSIALGYLLSGIYVGNAEHTSIIFGYSAIPWIMWRIDAGWRYGSYLAFCQAGAVWGLSALSAYPAFTILSWCFAGLWIVGRLFQSRWKPDELDAQSGGLNRSRVVTGFLLASVLGAIILAPTYFSFIYEAAGTTSRTEPLTREMVIADNPLPLGALGSFATPLVANKKLYVPDLWPHCDVSMLNVYTGAVVFVLAIFGIVAKPRDFWRWWILGLGLLALACALAELLPFRGWLFDLVYPFRFFRHAALFRAYWLFDITILACFGATDLVKLVGTRSATWPRYTITSLTCAFVACTMIVTCGLSWPVEASVNDFSARRLVLYCGVSAAAWLGMVMIRFVGRRGLAATGALIVTIAVFDAENVRSMSKGTMVARGSAAERWTTLDATHSTSIDLSANGWFRQRSSVYDLTAKVPVPNNDQLINKTPAFFAYSTHLNHFHSTLKDVPEVERTAVGDQRVWFSETPAKAVPSPANAEIFVNVAHRLGSVPLILHTREQMLSAQTANDDSLRSVADFKPMSPLHARINEYQPEILAFEVEAPADGWVMVTDRWARSWQATVNGRVVEIEGANFLFRAIPVTAGTNVIKMVYRPLSPYLVIMSWLTLLAVGTASIFLSRKGRKRNG
jgi:hypothetical protein